MYPILNFMPLMYHVMQFEYNMSPPGMDPRGGHRVHRPPPPHDKYLGVTNWVANLSDVINRHQKYQPDIQR